LAPEWNETLFIKLSSRWNTETLTLSVFDHDTLSKDTLLGKVTLKLSEIASLKIEEEKQYAMDLGGCDIAKGKITFALKLLKTRPAASSKGGKGAVEVEVKGKKGSKGGADVDVDLKIKGPKLKGPKVKGSGKGGADIDVDVDVDAQAKKAGADDDPNVKEVIQLSDSLNVKRTSIFIADTSDKKDKEVDAWIGEKTFWNKKKEEKYVVTISDPHLISIRKLKFVLQVTNRSPVKNKFIYVWLKRDSKAGSKKRKKTYAKLKLQGTEGKTSYETEVTYSFDEDTQENSTYTLVVQPKFRGFTHADMTVPIDISDFMIFKVGERKPEEKKEEEQEESSSSDDDKKKK